MKSAHQKNDIAKPLSIGMLYSYIFEGIKTLLNEKMSDSKKLEIKNEIKEQFRVLTGNKDISDQFRYLLRELKSSQLEEILYKNCNDIIKKPPNYKRYRFHSDDDIKDKFIKLNEQYKFFDESDADAIKLFNIYFKGLKLTADFIEFSNNYNDSLPAQYAYIMLVIFGRPNKNSPPFKILEQYFSKQDKSDQPVHDAFLLDLPVNDPKIKYISGWRKLIAHNKKGIIYFQQAIEIEKKIGKAPITIEQAELISSQLTYKRSDENNELALLCYQYHLSEVIFNRCLEIKWKNTDNIPNITIDGGTLGHPGYCLAKLPIGDPRAYILGHITNCCQSIGGFTEQCVIDGMTLLNNGFYVLLKSHKKGARPLINEKINYKDFNIIGQGYVWLSQDGNLTIDTWENLRQEDNQISVAMLKKFSQELTRQTDVMRVTIGRGGKTPSEFRYCYLISTSFKPKKNELAKIPVISDVAYVYYDNAVFYIVKSTNHCENLNLSIGDAEKLRQKLNPTKEARPLSSDESQLIKSITNHKQFITEVKKSEMMLEGYHCKDSFDQALVYFDYDKLNASIERILGSNFSYKPFWKDEDEFRTIIGVDEIVSVAEVNQINNLLLDPENQKFWLTLLSTDAVGENKKFIKRFGGGCILALSKLSHDHILTIENFKLINNFDSIQYIDWCVQELLKLNQAGILNDENRSNILEFKASNVGRISICDALVDLHNGGILNPQNRQLIMSVPRHCKVIAKSLLILSDAGLLNDKHKHLIADLLSSPEVVSAKMEEFARGLVDLSEAGIANDDNIECIMPFKFINPKAVAVTLVLLHKNNHENNAKNVSEYCNRITMNDIEVFSILDKKGYFNDDIFKMIIGSREKLAICETLICLDRDGLLTKDNIEAVIKSDFYLLNSLSFLSHAKLLDSDTFKTLLSIDQDNIEYGHGIIWNMYRARILNKESLESVVTNLGNFYQLFDAIELLQGNKIFDSKTFKEIFKFPEYANDVAKAWVILKQNTLFTDKIKGTLLNADLKNIVTIAKAFVFLHKSGLLIPRYRESVLKSAEQAFDVAQQIVFKNKWKLILADEIQAYLNKIKDVSSQSNNFGLFSFDYSNREILAAGQALISILKGDITCKFDKDYYLPILSSGGISCILNEFVIKYSPGDTKKIKDIKSLIDHACATAYESSDLSLSSQAPKS